MGIIKHLVYIGIILTLCGYCTYLHLNTPQLLEIKSIDTVYIRKDSILKIVKNSQNTLKQVDSVYKKDYIHITNQSSNADVEFFTNYLNSVYSE